MKWMLALFLWCSWSISVLAQKQEQKWFKTAEKFRLGLKQSKDWSQAFFYYEKACEAKHGESCWRQGLLKQSFLSKQPSKTLLGKSNLSANQLFRKACRLGFSLGCVDQAKHDLKLQTNQASSLRLLKQNCQLKKSGEACYYWKSLSPSRSNVSPHSILKRLQQECLLRMERSCYLVGALFHKNSWKIPQQSKQSLLFFQKGCVLDHADSCDFLGILYGTGLGTQQNFTQSRFFHKKSCELFHSDGCAHLSGLLLRGLGGNKDFELARKLYQRACMWNNPQACLLLSEMIIRGEGGDRDIRQAFVAYSKACRLGSSVACQRSKSLSDTFGYK